MRPDGLCAATAYSGRVLAAKTNELLAKLPIQFEFQLRKRSLWTTVLPTERERSVSPEPFVPGGHNPRSLSESSARYSRRAQALKLPCLTLT
jgi:hypothetical protein